MAEPDPTVEPTVEDQPLSTAATAVPDNPTVPPTNPVDTVDTVGNDDPQNSVPVESPEIPVETETTTPNYVPEVGEHVGDVQPEAPPVVPASAAPAQDAVTINGHLRKVSDDLSAVVEYIKAFLADHEASKVVKELESVVEKVKSLVQ